MKSIYRGIISFLFLLQFAWVFFPWSFPDFLCSRHEVDWAGAGLFSDERFVMFTSLGFTALYFITYVGLYFFQAWARMLLLIGCVVGGFTIPLYGISIESGARAMVGYFLTFGEGAVVSLSYFSSLSSRFVIKK